MWERYCRGVSAILFVVDSAVPLPAEGKSSGNPARAGRDEAASEAGAESAAPAGVDPWAVATDELHSLMSRPQLAGIPLLVLATKNDVKGAASAEDVIRIM